MTLFEECIEALREHVIILPEDETKEIFTMFEQRIPFTSWGRIDWDKIEGKISIENIENLIQTIKNRMINLDTSIFVLWDEGTLPVVKTDLIQCTTVLDDVLAVSFDTWLWSPEQGYVIEFYHEGEVTIGFV